jgi:uncharacterized small protein (DUF1192 family)
MTVAVGSDADHDALVTAVNELYERVERLEDENERLREELAEERERSARERADVRSDVHELTEAVESDDDDGVQDGSGDANPTTPDGASSPTQAPQTPLGDCVTLPETVAEQELTANIKRARDVAADVVDYGRSIPVGYAITSSELRTVLTAMNEGDGKAYTETVRRVMEYLDELGGDDVAVKETRGGQQTVIFDDDFVKRTVAWRQLASNDVVAETGATG